LFYQLTAANDDPHEHAHGDEDMDNASQASSSWTDSHSAPPGSPRRRHHYDLDPFQDDEHLHGAHSQASFAQSDPFLAPLDITAPLRQVNHSLEGTPGASALVTSTVELRRGWSPSSQSQSSQSSQSSWSGSSYSDYTPSDEEDHHSDHGDHDNYHEQDGPDDHGNHDGYVDHDMYDGHGDHSDCYSRSLSPDDPFYNLGGARDDIVEVPGPRQKSPVVVNLADIPDSDDEDEDWGTLDGIDDGPGKAAARRLGRRACRKILGELCSSTSDNLTPEHRFQASIYRVLRGGDVDDERKKKKAKRRVGDTGDYVDVARYFELDPGLSDSIKTFDEWAREYFSRGHGPAIVLRSAFWRPSPSPAPAPAPAPVPPPRQKRVREHSLDRSGPMRQPNPEQRHRRDDEHMRDSPLTKRARHHDGHGTSQVPVASTSRPSPSRPVTGPSSRLAPSRSDHPSQAEAAARKVAARRSELQRRLARIDNEERFNRVAAAHYERRVHRGERDHDRRGGDRSPARNQPSATSDLSSRHSYRPRSPSTQPRRDAMGRTTTRKDSRSGGIRPSGVRDRGRE
jgi:hypothetical protein